MQDVKIGQVFELIDPISFYKGRQVEVIGLFLEGFAWVKLANYGPGSIEFTAKIADLKEPDIYAVVWVDKMVGPLTLKKPSAEEAVASAKAMIAKGAGKIEQVRAIKLTADNEIIDLMEVA